MTELIWREQLLKYLHYDIGLLMTRAFQNAQMHIFGQCGHWAQVEHADEFNELVLNFIHRH